MSAVLPFWQSAAGLLAATALVLAWAVVARRRPEAVPGPADAPVVHLASVPAGGRHRRPEQEPDVLPFVPGPNYRDIDDWTADLPTAALAIVVDEPDPVEFCPRPSSPSRTLRERCWSDTPIFATLARELSFDSMLVAA